jgi:hypothetical protein
MQRAASGLSRRWRRMRAASKHEPHIHARLAQWQQTRRAARSFLLWGLHHWSAATEPRIRAPNNRDPVQDALPRTWPPCRHPPAATACEGQNVKGTASRIIFRLKPPCCTKCSSSTLRGAQRGERSGSRRAWGCAWRRDACGQHCLCKRQTVHAPADQRPGSHLSTSTAL